MPSSQHIVRAKHSLLGLATLLTVLASAGQAAATEPAGTRAAPLSVSVTVQSRCAIDSRAATRAESVRLACFGGAEPIVTSSSVATASGAGVEIATILF
jgi:hypothetical protein